MGNLNSYLGARVFPFTPFERISTSTKHVLLPDIVLTQDGYVDGGYRDIIREDQLVDTLWEQHSDL